MIKRGIRSILWLLTMGLVNCSSSDPGPDLPITLGAVKAGGSAWDQSNGIAVDPWGNTYITGFFTSKAQFGATSISTTAGSNDIFVAKYDTKLELMWVTTAGGPGFDQGVAIDVDRLGNAYVTGSYSGNAKFGTEMLSTPGSDIFVAKLDRDGRFVWARKGAGSGTGVSIKTDGTVVYATGYFLGSARFSGEVMNSRGGNDLFIVKYQAESGTADWVTRAGGQYNDLGTSLALDGQGNVYVTGQFSEVADWGSQTIFAQRLYQGFLTKLDKEGHVSWIQLVGGAEYPTNASIAVNAAGDCYIAGNFTNSMTLGGTTLNTTGEADLYVAKFLPSGNAVWVRNAGGSLGASSIAIDHFGNSYVTGPFGGKAFFGDYAIYSVAGDADIFVAKFNNAGGMLWTQEGAFDSFFRDAIAVDASGNVTVTGSFNGTARLGSSTLKSIGREKDVFVWRLGAN